MKLTVGIKALNEEKHIAACIESILQAVDSLCVEYEVILADSGSSDRTIEIARQYPINIVQLRNPGEKSCGTGAQLAFQYATGDYFCLLDGDMQLQPNFLSMAIAHLEANPSTAGVGGRIQEMNPISLEFQIRAKSFATEAAWQPGIVDRLDGGGLYRSDMIRETGYFADRNLHAFEEFELASRLRSHGWQLVRIDLPSIHHFGHTLGGYKLLWRRLRTGYAGATGEVLRSAIGSKQLPIVISRLSHIKYGMAVLVWWSALLACGVAALLRGGSAPIVSLILVILMPIAFLTWRRRSLALGIYSFISWNLNAWGLLTGVLRPRISPSMPIDAIVIK